MNVRRPFQLRVVPNEPESPLFYYFVRDNEVEGPLNEESMRSLFADGKITERTLVAIAGAETWESYSDIFPKQPPPLPPPPSLRKGIPAAVGVAVAFPNPLTIPLAIGVVGYEMFRQAKADKEYHQNNTCLQYDGSRDWPLVVGDEGDVALSCRNCHSIYRGHPLSLICKTCYDHLPERSISISNLMNETVGKSAITVEGLPIRLPFQKPRTIFEAKQGFRRFAAWMAIAVFIVGCTPVGPVLALILAMGAIFLKYRQAAKQGAFSQPTRPVHWTKWM